jgi:hypothetical protein
MDAVLVEIAPPEISREHQESLLRACGVAAKPLKCVLGEPGDEPPALLAIVVWEPDGNAHIEVGVRRQTRVEWADRRLSFSSGDPEKQRWEAAGLAAGTVAASLSRRPAPEPLEAANAPAPQPPEPEEPAEAEQSVASSHSSSHWGVDLGLLVQSGFEGSVRAGGALGLRYAQPGALRLELRGSLGGDRSTESIDGSSVEVSTLAGRVGAFAGAGFDVGFAELGVLAGPFVERVLVEVEPDRGQAVRFVGGAELTTELRQRIAERFIVFLAADVGTRFGNTFVTVDGFSAGSLPPPFIGARVGLGVSY